MTLNLGQGSQNWHERAKRNEGMPIQQHEKKEYNYISISVLLVTVDRRARLFPCNENYLLDIPVFQRTSCGCSREIRVAFLYPCNQKFNAQLTPRSVHMRGAFIMN